MNCIKIKDFIVIRNDDDQDSIELIFSDCNYGMGSLVAYADLDKQILYIPSNTCLPLGIAIVRQHSNFAVQYVSDFDRNKISFKIEG